MFIIDFICGLLGSIIRVIFNIFGQNYFVALLIFTFLTKLILFPLMLKQLKSTAALQKIAPEDRRLREKYKDNPEKLAQELGKLYTENKIKPLGGCIIPLIQIPIVLAMFWVVKQPLTYITQTDPAIIESYTQEYLGKEEVTESEMNEYEINIAKKYNLLDMNIGFGLNLGDTPKDAFSNDGNNRVSKLTLIIPLLLIAISQFPESNGFAVPYPTKLLCVFVVVILLVSLPDIGKSSTMFPEVLYLTISIVVLVA